MSVTPSRPRCGAQAAPGAAFCKFCGSRLNPSVQQPFRANELLLGGIPTAFSVLLGWGPVRIVFTDQRVLVLWTGPHQFLPNQRAYLE